MYTCMQLYVYMHICMFRDICGCICNIYAYLYVSAYIEVYVYNDYKIICICKYKCIIAGQAIIYIYIYIYIYILW